MSARPFAVVADASPHPHPTNRWCSMCEATPQPDEVGVAVYRRLHFPRGLNARNATESSRPWRWVCSRCAKKIAKASEGCS